jgi:hypothetical protein
VLINQRAAQQVAAGASTGAQQSGDALMVAYIGHVDLANLGYRSVAAARAAG